MARIAGYFLAYSHAQFIYLLKRHEHETLVNKIASLSRYHDGENRKLNELVAFEDKARIALGLEPISTDVRKAGIGGHPSAAESTELPSAFPVVDSAHAVQESLSILLRKAQLQNSTFEQVDEHVGRLSAYWAQRPSIWPTTGRVTSTFGYRDDPISGQRVHHDGLDIANEIGTPVFATAEGIVKDVGFKQDFGKAVFIEHQQTGLVTIYAHLSNYVVVPNQYVKRGELIAFMGNTGKSTGPHLHYEIHERGMPINAAKYILPTDYIVD